MAETPARGHTSGILKRSAIVTLDGVGQQPEEIRQARTLLRTVLTDGGIVESAGAVQDLFPEFCERVRNGSLTEQAQFLTLMNRLTRSNPLSATRITQMTRFLETVQPRLCNRFVISSSTTDFRMARKVLRNSAIATALRINSVDPVRIYRQSRKDIESMLNFAKRPPLTVGVICSPLLSEALKGIKHRLTAETPHNGIDDDSNGYVDDVFGLGSDDEGELVDEDLIGGFLSLKVARDIGEVIQYTSVDAARAMFYGILNGSEIIVIPTLSSDSVVMPTAKTAMNLGIQKYTPTELMQQMASDSVADLNVRIGPEGKDNLAAVPVAEPIIRGNPSKIPGVGTLGKKDAWLGCTAVEIGNRCILTAEHCTDYIGYSQDRLINDSSMFVPILRTASPYKSFLAGMPKGYLGVARLSIADISVKYTGAFPCKTSDVRDGSCAMKSINPENGDAYYPFSWNPKPLGKAVIGQFVTVVGYSGADLTYPNDWQQRSAVHKVEAIYTAHENKDPAFIPWESIKIVPHGSKSSIWFGDSGGPALRGNSIVGIVSHGEEFKELYMEQFISPAAYYASVDGPAGDWIRDQKDKLCRKIGKMSVTIRAVEGSQQEIDPYGFTTIVQSTDRKNVPELNRSTVCQNSLSCSADFIDLNMTVASPPQWQFVKWSDHEKNQSCRCTSNQFPNCAVKAEELNAREEIRGLSCEAVFKYVTPTATPTNTSTPTKTPIKTSTPTLTPTATSTSAQTKTATPTKTHTPTATSTSTRATTATPTTTAAPTGSPTSTPSGSPTPLKSPSPSPSPAVTATASASSTATARWTYVAMH